MTTVQLPGSAHRHAFDHHSVLSECHPGEHVEVTMTLDRTKLDRSPLSFAVLLQGFADEHKLNIGLIDDRRTIAKVSGEVADMEMAFNVSLWNRSLPNGGMFRYHSSHIRLPLDIAPFVTGVFGLDTRPVAKTHFRRSEWKTCKTNEVRAFGKPATVWKYGFGFQCHLTQPSGTFTPLQLASIYDFPAGDGAGQTIAIIELGGGYSTKDLQTYFSGLGLAMPDVSMVSVDGGKNTTGSDADGEVMLDIEVAGAIAPKAKIVVYFAGNTDKGFIDAISTAVHDQVNKPSVISISWGGPEESWTKSAMQAMDTVFAEAVAAGITVLVAAGDDGSSDGVTDGHTHVDFPASSPHVTACGGTKLVVNDFPASSPHVTACGGTKLVVNGFPASSPHVTACGGTKLVVNDSSITETVWNEMAAGEGATGGGYSIIFPEPAAQAPGRPGGKHRGVPDVAANADPVTGYVVRVDGQDTVIGGTSAVAPLFAGLVARINAITGKRVGLLNTVAYANTGAFRDITSGNNGAYSAGKSWDPCTGLGAPIGRKLLAAVQG